jgi:hypothetical protein
MSKACSGGGYRTRGGGNMASLVVWAVLVGVAVLLGLIARNFSVCTVRWVSGITAVILISVITKYGVDLWLQAHPKSPPSNLVNAFTTGVDALIKNLLRPLLFGYQESPPGPIGRGVAAFLLLLGYRGLEAWTMRGQAPQLNSTTLDDRDPRAASASVPAAGAGGANAQLHDQLIHELKFRLAAIEVRAPAILPGGSRTGGLASIAEASGVNGAGVAGAIIRFAGSIWPSPRRFELRVWVEPPARQPASPDEVQATVYLENPRTGATVATKTLACADINEASSMVAGYVARQIFTRDPSTPPWCYGRVDGRDLGASLLARLERVPTESSTALQASRRAQIETLRQWASTGRSSGIVRYELAQLLDLDGDHLAALRLHAMSLDQYPRFYRDRYRLGISLEMIAADEFPLADNAEAERQLDEVLGFLHRQGLTTRDKHEPGDLVPSGGGQAMCTLSPSLRLELLVAAMRVLGQVRAQLTFRHVVWATLRHRNERAVWLPYWTWLPSWGPRRRWAFHDGVRVAELLVATRIRHLELTAARDCADDKLLTAMKTQFRKHRRHCKGAVRIASAISDETTIIGRLLDQLDQPDQDVAVTPRRTEVWPRRLHAVRWVHVQRGKASWQAAYNAACLYAALARRKHADKAPVEAEKAAVEAVIRCLRSAIDNPRSEMERPSDWISRDPDLSRLLYPGEGTAAFAAFLAEQWRLDYPGERFTGAGPATRRPAADEPVTGDALAKYVITHPAGAPTA